LAPNDWRATFYKAQILRSRAIATLQSPYPTPGLAIDAALQKYHEAMDMVSLEIDREEHAPLHCLLGALLCEAAELPPAPHQKWRMLATQHLTRGVQDHPTWQGHFSLSQAYAGIRMPEQSLYHAELAIRFNASWQTRLGRVIALAELNKADEAERYLNEVAPELQVADALHGLALVIRASIANTRGQFADALQLCERGRQLGFSHPDENRIRAEALCGLGRRTEALSALEPALAFDPEDPLYIRTRDQIRALPLAGE
ncbi:MAG: tetratricopeptide repeat protein, partial [Rhodoglobus sp.]